MTAYYNQNNHPENSQLPNRHPYFNPIMDLIGTDRLSILNGLLEDPYDPPSILDQWLVKYKYSLAEIKNTDWYKKIPQKIQLKQRDLIDDKINSLAYATPELETEVNFFDECEIAATTKNPEMYETISMFIDENPQFLNLKDKEHRTALRIACFHQNAELAELLIKKGADVNTVNYAGNTIMPYLLVTFEKNGNSQKILDMLFDNGANMYCRNLKNNSLMQIACHCYDYDAVEYLLSRGYKIQQDEQDNIIDYYAEAKNPYWVKPPNVDMNLFNENYDKILNLVKDLKI